MSWKSIGAIAPRCYVEREARWNPVCVRVLDALPWTYDALHATVGSDPPGRCNTVTDADRTSAQGESCPDCRAMVADLEAHKRWHSRLVSDLAHAVENEIKRKQSSS